MNMTYLYKSMLHQTMVLVNIMLDGGFKGNGRWKFTTYEAILFLWRF